MTELTPALYVGQLVHVRHSPFLRTFRHGIAMWLVDLDRLPVLPGWLRPLARWSARDHHGSPDRTIRANVDSLLAEHGIDLANGRILMLASARVLGYAFNPLTVYWCHAASGGLRCVVAEVSNTYGQRHCYLLPVAASDHGDGSRFEVAKTFPVSPFFEVGGRYRMRLPLPDRRLSLTVTLTDGTTTPLTAVLTAQRRDVTPGSVLALVLSGRLVPQRVIALIRLHGLRLWLRGLPLRPGPHHDKWKESS